jgi:hypothetical protein
LQFPKRRPNRNPHRFPNRNLNRPRRPNLTRTALYTLGYFVATQRPKGGYALLEGK